MVAKIFTLSDLEIDVIENITSFTTHGFPEV